MVRNAAIALDAKAPNHVELCAMAKLFATETCTKVRNWQDSLHNKLFFRGFFIFIFTFSIA